MVSRFFIDCPVFAWVIAISIMLGGVLAILSLPIEQYPRIAPPSVVINASHPGASAKTLEDTVTQAIKQKISGIDHFRYMSAISDSSGNVSITLTFDPEADPDIAQVQVQNKLQLATRLLPQEVQQQGITVAKAAKSFLMVIGFVSTDGSMSQGDIEDYVGSNVLDPISRVTGVGDTTLFGRKHAMRVWLDPDKLHGFGVTTADVVAEIEVKSPFLFLGYLGEDDTISLPLTEDGFFRTGDLGHLNAKGSLVIDGRTRDIIKKGGHFVSLREIEILAEQKPSVQEAVAMPVPHDFYGEDFCLAIILREGQTAEALPAIKRWLHDNLVNYKWPQHIIVRETFPRTASGKVLKKVLADEIAQTERLM